MAAIVGGAGREHMFMRYPDFYTFMDDPVLNTLSVCGYMAWQQPDFCLLVQITANLSV